MSIFKQTTVEMSDGIMIYTLLLLPAAAGKFPIVFIRNPYCLAAADFKPNIDRDLESLLASGYAIVYQHCRGTGRSEGDCLPFVNERQDGLETLAWMRQQDFYAGEVYPYGGSYLSAAHLFYLDPVPFDIKGAILEIFDCNYYNVVYRNGFFRHGLTNWFVDMYKKNSGLKKNFVSPDSLRTMPASGFSQAVFAEDVPVFDEQLNHPDEDDAFWHTTAGGHDSYNVIRNARIPILLTTSLHDLFADGVLAMWDSIPAENRANCALLVTPYDHSKKYQEGYTPLKFANGEFDDVCPNYVANWLNHIRNDEPLEFIRPGEVAYYILYKNEWRHEAFLGNGKIKHEFYLNSVLDSHALGTAPEKPDEITYLYNPYAPASFRGGICNGFDGMQIQDKPDSRYDIISFLSEPFPKDALVKGKMGAALSVRTDCEDTCFYLRVSLVKDGIAYALRDDITSISRQHRDYAPNSEVDLQFEFTAHAFLIQKGDRLRVDVSSSSFPYFSLHTNHKGLQSAQKTAKVAHNTLVCGKSKIVLWAEE